MSPHPDTETKPDLTQGLPSERVRPGRPVLGRVEGRDVVLIRHEGGLAAVSAACTHLGAPLDKGLVAEGQIRCPWHHARFSLADGSAVGGPAVTPLSCYPVEERGGLVRVRPKAAPAPAKSPAADDGRIVIVGTGAGGHALAAALGRAGQGGRVTLIGAEPDGPYDRTFCSKQYLQGAKSRDDCLLPETGLEDVTLRSGCEVVSIDRAAREVVIAGGERVGYDRLVLATGAEPVRPDFPGAGQAHVLRSLADADRLIAAAEDARAVAVLGASFIGLEVAAALKARGLDVTVIATDEVPLVKILGPEAGRFVQGLHEGKGMRFRLGTSLASFDGGVAVTTNGARIPADLLVLGTGVRPRVALAEAAGLALEGGGVAVDATLRTEDPAIWAIGDIASYPDPLGGARLRIEHWVHAERQGEHLARDILSGAPGAFTETPFFWSGHHGTQLRYVGHAPAKPRRISGEVASGDFAIRYGEGRRTALLTCKRDMEALVEERDQQEATRAQVALAAE